MTENDDSCATGRVSRRWSCYAPSIPPVGVFWLSEPFDVEDCLPMPVRHRLCLKSDVPAGGGLECVAGDRIVAVFQVDERYFALDGICPHAGGPLAKGELRGCVVTCPWHGWQFDVSTGQHQLNPRIQQPTLSVIVEGDELFVEIP